MATGEKAKAARAKQRAAATKEHDKAVAVNRAEREANEDAAARRAAASIATPKKVKADPEGDIDQRMAALLKDHQEMGARPR